MVNDNSESSAKPKFVGSFFGPKYKVKSSGTSEEVSVEPSQPSEEAIVPEPSVNQVGSISQRRMARKSRGSPKVTFCPMCGKVNSSNSSCDCGYKQ